MADARTRSTDDGVPLPDLATIRALRAARDLIDRGYATELTITQVAAAVHLSQAHFTRCFRRVYGETPHQYLMTRRLERAAALIRHGMGVTDACMAVGWSSLGSFSTRFRQVYGVSPSQYAATTPDELAELPPFIASRITRQPRHQPDTD